MVSIRFQQRHTKIKETSNYASSNEESGDINS